MSGNSWKWERVADKTTENCRSWQTIRFNPPRSVVFIRIVGTHNTANEVFHCVHFECPVRSESIAGGSTEISKSPSRKGKRLCSTVSKPSTLSTPPPETATEAVNMDHQDGNSTDDSAISASLP